LKWYNPNPTIELAKSIILSLILMSCIMHLVEEKVNPHYI